VHRLGHFPEQVCLEDRIRFIRKEWYPMHSVTDISITITMGSFNSIRAEEDEKLKRTMAT
jgi:hypothetical protein